MITKEKYKRYLDELDNLMDIDPMPDTSEGDRVELLSIAIGQYEDHHFKFEKPSLLSRIKFRIINKIR